MEDKERERGIMIIGPTPSANEIISEIEASAGKVVLIANTDPGLISIGADQYKEQPKRNPFEPEPFIIDALPRLEERYIPKHLSNEPWYACFDKRKRKKH